MCAVPENFVFQNEKREKTATTTTTMIKYRGWSTQTQIKNQQINGFNFIIFRYLDCVFLGVREQLLLFTLLLLLSHKD